MVSSSSQQKRTFHKYSPTLFICVGPNQSGKNELVRSFIEKLQGGEECNSVVGVDNLSPYYRVVQSDIAVPTEAYWSFFNETSSGRNPPLLYRREHLVTSVESLQSSTRRFYEYTQAVEDEPKEDALSHEENHKIMIGVDVGEIVRALEEVKHNMENNKVMYGGVIVTSSQSVDLLQFIEMHEQLQGLYRIKTVVIDSPRKIRNRRMLEKGLVRNLEQVDKILDMGDYIVERIVMEKSRDMIRIDNNSTVEEGAKRLYDMVVLQRFTPQETVDHFYKNRQTSEDYMRDSKASEILEHLMSKLLVERPGAPIQYLIQCLQGMQQNEREPLFTTEDIENIFDMLSYQMGNRSFLTREEVHSWAKRSLVMDQPSMDDLLISLSQPRYTKQEFVQSMIESRALQ